MLVYVGPFLQNKWVNKQAICAYKLWKHRKEETGPIKIPGRPTVWRKLLITECIPLCFSFPNPQNFKSLCNHTVEEIGYCRVCFHRWTWVIGFHLARGPVDFGCCVGTVFFLGGQGTAHASVSVKYWKLGWGREASQWEDPLVTAVNEKPNR